MREHGLEDRVRLIESDLFAGVQAVYDLIVANPPYVSRDEYASLPAEYRHEPALGLRAGEDGAELIARILEEAAPHLDGDGLLVVEAGSSRAALEARYPDLPFTWFEFERGGENVFLLRRKTFLDRGDLALPESSRPHFHRASATWSSIPGTPRHARRFVYWECCHQSAASFCDATERRRAADAPGRRTEPAGPPTDRPGPLDARRRLPVGCAMRIRNVLHKGLRRFIEDDSAAAIPPAAVPKLRRILSFLQDMEREEELRTVSSWKAHRLVGDRKGVWSLSVTKNWRITFRIDPEENEIVDLDYEDYH